MTQEEKIIAETEWDVLRVTITKAGKLVSAAVKQHDSIMPGLELYLARLTEADTHVVFDVMAAYSAHPNEPPSDFMPPYNEAMDKAMGEVRGAAAGLLNKLSELLPEGHGFKDDIDKLLGELGAEKSAQSGLAEAKAINETWHGLENFAEQVVALLTEAEDAHAGKKTMPQILKVTSDFLAAVAAVDGDVRGMNTRLSPAQEIESLEAFAKRSPDLLPVYCESVEKICRTLEDSYVEALNSIYRLSPKRPRVQAHAARLLKQLEAPVPSGETRHGLASGYDLSQMKPEGSA